MTLVSQSIPSFLSGVSQAPPSSRLPSQVSEQINCYSHPAYGVTKRPPSVRQAEIAASEDGSAFMHTVNRDASNRYRVIISGGDIAVFDAVTGDSVPVNAPAGMGYLESDDPERDFRAVTIGDSTYIVNRKTMVRAANTKSPAVKNEALISIRAADFATYYGVTLDGHTVQYSTPDGSSPHDRSTISTEYIARGIKHLIDANGFFSGFVVTQYGSTLHITKSDGTDFSVSASDGLADQGILAIKGTVQRFDDLPERAKKGFTVEITGDPTNKFDNYYVTYDDNGAPNLAGVWRETVRPGVLTGLDAETMPWLLSLSGALLDGAIAKGIPNAPAVSSEADTETYFGWEKASSPSYAAHDPTVQVVLNEHQEGFTSCLTSLNGEPATIRVNFDVNTVQMVSGTAVVVELWVSDTASTGDIPFSDFTLVTSRQYNQGMSLYNEFFEYAASLPQNTQIEMRLRYLDGATPSNNAKLASIRLKTLQDNNTSSIVVTSTTARIVQFDVNATYPQGTVVLVTTGGTPDSYTLPSDMSGAAVATAIVTKFSGATATDEGAGRLRITGTGVPTVTIAVSFDTATRFYNPDMGLTPGSLVGKEVDNLSDGGSGIITANTATVIVVASLSGGTNNTFAVGDVCRVIAGGTTFTFAPALWKAREAGDIDSNPNPSFVGQTITDVFFHRNRLGFTAGPNVILSRAAVHLQFFRQTVTALLPDDVIDVKSTQQQSSNWHSAIPWNKQLTLWCDEGQYVLVGEPALSPQSVGIEPLSQFTNSPDVRPFVAGRRVFFTRSRGDACQLFEYSVVNQTGTPDAEECTKHVPTYIRGLPLQIVGDAALGFLAVRTDAAPNVLYVQHFQFDNQNKVQEAWGKWVFDDATSILAMDMLDGVLALAVRREDGVYLESIDLVVQPTDEPLAYQDGRQGTVGSFTGTLYESRVDLSTIYYRALQRFGSNVATTVGRLILRRIILNHHDSRDFTITVSLAGRSPKTYQYTNVDGLEDGSMSVPVMGRNTEVSISIGNTSANGFRFTGLDWEGTYENRAQRV